MFLYNDLNSYPLDICLQNLVLLLPLEEQRNGPLLQPGARAKVPKGFGFVYDPSSTQ
jgi:hypothetical protein